MKTRKIFTLLIAITLVLGMITGCGNNDAKAGDDDTLYLRLVSPLLPAEGFTWEAYMRMSGAMLAECAEVCFLPDWKESKGAKYEFGEAMAQNKPFFFFADWEREGSQNAEK